MKIMYVYIIVRTIVTSIVNDFIIGAFWAVVFCEVGALWTVVFCKVGAFWSGEFCKIDTLSLCYLYMPVTTNRL